MASQDVVSARRALKGDTVVIDSAFDEVRQSLAAAAPAHTAAAAAPLLPLLPLLLPLPLQLFRRRGVCVW